MNLRTINYMVKAYEIPEITDVILDHLHADKTSLASCALVCTDWALAARHRLFSSIHLRGRDSSRFLAFLQSSHAVQLRNHVRELRWKETDGDSLDIQALCDVIASLPRVYTLHLTFDDFKKRPTSYPYGSVKARLGRVQRLSVHYKLRLNKTCNTVQPLLAFLSMFTLDHLELDSMFHTSETTPVDSYRVGYTPVPSAPCVIRSLAVANGDALYHEAEILSQIFPNVGSPLEALAYKCHSAADVHSLGDFLKSSGRSLRSLEIVVPPRGWTGSSELILPASIMHDLC